MPTDAMCGAGFGAQHRVRAVHRLAETCAGASDCSLHRAELCDAARALRDEAHAALHTGPWRDVAPVWRAAFMFAALHLAQAGRPSTDVVHAYELIRELDLGLMLGDGTYRSALLNVVASIERVELRDAERAGHPGRVPGEACASAWLPEPLADGATGAIAPSGAPLRSLLRPSLERFFLSCMTVGQPAVLRGGMEAWPAMGVRSWRDLAYLKRTAGHRVVPVEVGASYLAADWSEQLMPLADFIDEHMLPQLTPAGAQAQASGASPPPEAARAPEHAKKRARHDRPPPAERPSAASGRVGYLAQHALLEQVARLRADVIMPDYCALSTEPSADDDETTDGPASSAECARINVWLGPAGTVSPLHHDPEHNLLAQVAGTKYVRLYAPEESANLYPHESGLHKVSSQVHPLTDVDASRFPRFAGARYVDGYLRAGEMLYIPPSWWHYVQALQPSCSVNFWWT
jgi:lysine-specific demethylase 8